MRTFKVGDKVKFLDQEGGGIVTKIVSPGLVNVEVDGFDIPTLTKEIVLDFVEDKVGKMFTSQNKSTDENTIIHKERDSFNLSEDQNDIRQEHLYLSRQGLEKEKGVYLAFVPCDQKWLIGSEYFVYLVNNSDYTLLYSLLLKDVEQKCFVGEGFGSVNKKSRFLLSTVSNDQLDKWSSGVIQLLLHKDKSKSVLMPSNFNIKIKTSKFFKEGCFESTGLFVEKALIVQIMSLNSHDIATYYEQSLPKQQDETKNLQDINVDSAIVGINNNKPTSFFDKHLVNRYEAEVDLHIEELIDSVKGLNNADILNIQINYFRKCLNKSIETNIDKVIFIHGVGQGILKHNIEKELDKYSFIHYFPASMQKYGVGATEVIIGKNKRQ